jgi:hypothetical protein
MEFEALGEQSVLKNVKQGESYNEAKRQAAFRWLSEQAQLRDRRVLPRLANRRSGQKRETL